MLTSSLSSVSFFIPEQSYHESHLLGNLLDLSLQHVDPDLHVVSVVLQTEVLLLQFLHSLLEMLVTPARRGATNRQQRGIQALTGQGTKSQRAFVFQKRYKGQFPLALVGSTRTGNSQAL